MEVLEKLTEEWRDIGRRVFIPDAALDVIEAENKTNEDRLKAVVLYMLYTHPDPCWRILLRIENLLDMGEYDSYHDFLKEVFKTAKSYAEKVAGQYKAPACRHKHTHTHTNARAYTHIAG